MAAMKPRTGDGPMEAVKEGRLIIVRVPLEGGGRLVVSVNDAEAKELFNYLCTCHDSSKSSRLPKVNTNQGTTGNSCQCG